MAVETTPEGYLVVTAKLSRTGIYDYRAAELRRWGVPVADGIPDAAILRVYRDADEVFSADALRSFEMAPLTTRHPEDAVGPDTIAREFRGIVEAPVVRDGDHAAARVRIMHADAIRRYRAGQRQLSAGYTSVLDMRPGRAPSGDVYDYRQTSIRGNHVALVQAGRAGTAQLDTMEADMADKAPATPTVDAVEYGKMEQRLADAEAKLAELTKERDRLAGERDGLAASAMSDEDVAAKIADGVKAELAARDDRARVVEKATKLAPALKMGDEASVRDIMVAAIKSQRADITIDDTMSDDRVAGIFDGIRPVERKDPAHAAPRRNATPARSADSRPDFSRIRALIR